MFVFVVAQISCNERRYNANASKFKINVFLKKKKLNEMSEAINLLKNIGRLLNNPTVTRSMI